MPEPKPTYKVNPAVLPIAPEFMAAIKDTAQLLQDALSTITPLSGNDKIMVDYHDWDMKCNILGAIREKYDEWKHTTFPVISDRDRIINEISDLLKKAGY